MRLHRLDVSCPASITPAFDRHSHQGVTALVQPGALSSSWCAETSGARVGCRPAWTPVARIMQAVRWSPRLLRTWDAKASTANVRDVAPSDVTAVERLVHGARARP